MKHHLFQKLRIFLFAAIWISPLVGESEGVFAQNITPDMLSSFEKDVKVTGASRAIMNSHQEIEDTYRLQSVQNDPMKFITHAHPLKMIPIRASGRDQTLVFASLGENKDIVGSVHVVPETFKGPYEPPRVIAIVYHDIGEDKEFCSLQTVHHHLNADTGKISRITLDQRVDDDVANEVLDLIYDRTEWRDLSNIKLLRTTSPNVASPKVTTL